MTTSTRIAIIGGAGAMGRITVRDLVEFAGKNDEIVIADYDYAKATEFADSMKDPRVSAVRVDVRNHDQAAGILQGCNIIINSVQYQLNLDVMRIALKAGAHYVDLGGLFHMTRRQMELHDEFESRGLLAIIGMGAAPGITNILSRMGADALDKVTEIHTRVAGRDLSKYSYTPALPVSYSLQTILEEFSFQPAVFTKGKFTFVEPMSGNVPHKFPNPVGVRRPMYTIHSEVATLPLSFANKGVKEVTFKIAFDDDFVDRVRFLRDMGMASHEPVDIGGVKVPPIAVVNKVAMAQKAPKVKGKPKQYEIVRAIVKGWEKSAGKQARMTYILDCHTEGMPKWGVGTDINTGTPPAIAALMIGRGEIRDTGVVAPENCIDAKSFVRELARRKMKVEVTRKRGWDVQV
jgi:saccharopine dehydrogenase (NAD+, L-lysine-forming)